MSCGNPFSAEIDLASNAQKKSLCQGSNNRTWWVDDLTLCYQEGTCNEQNSQWSWGTCQYKCTSDGFVYSEDKKTCIDDSCDGEKTRDCSDKIENGNGEQTRFCSKGVSSWGECSVTTCDYGFIESNNKCEPVKCDFNGTPYSANATVTVENCMNDATVASSEEKWQCKETSGVWSMAKIESCHATSCAGSKYKLENGKCELITVKCSYSYVDGNGNPQTLEFNEGEEKSIDCSSKIANSNTAFEKYKCENFDGTGKLQQTQTCKLGTCASGYNDSDGDNDCEESTITCSYTPVGQSNPVTLKVNESYTDPNRSCFADEQASATQYTVSCTDQDGVGTNISQCTIKSCNFDFHISADGKSCQAHQCLNTDPNTNITSVYTPFANDAYSDTLAGQDCSDSLATKSNLASATKTWTCKTKSDNSGADWDKSATCQVSCLEKYSYSSSENKCNKLKCIDSSRNLSVEVDSAASNQTCLSLPLHAVSGAQTWSCVWNSSAQAASWSYGDCTVSACDSNYKLNISSNSCSELTCTYGNITLYTYNDGNGKTNYYDAPNCATGDGVASSSKRYTCTATNGGTASATTSVVPGSCQVNCKTSEGWTWDNNTQTCIKTSCSSDSFLSGSTCVKRTCNHNQMTYQLGQSDSDVCNVNGNPGTKTLTCQSNGTNDSPGGEMSAGSCNITSCADSANFYLSNGSCLPRTCVYNNITRNVGWSQPNVPCTGDNTGTGTKTISCVTNGGNEVPGGKLVEGSCNITSCTDAANFYLSNGQCIARHCIDPINGVYRALNFSSSSVPCTSNELNPKASSGTKTATCQSSATSNTGASWVFGSCVITACKESLGYYFRNSDKSCNSAKSCNDILTIDSTKRNSDGLYQTYPWKSNSSDGSLLQVGCDMTISGGGWTAMSFNLVHTQFGGVITEVNRAADDPGGIDLTYGPHTRDGDKSHTYYYTFNVPFGYTHFRMGGDTPHGGPFTIRSNAASNASSDVNQSVFTQSNWSKAFHGDATNQTGDTVGDVSFGSTTAPVTSLARRVSGLQNYNQNAEIRPFDPGTTYSVGSPATQFRFGWGENGTQHEGWYPWYSGLIWFR